MQALRDYAFIHTFVAHASDGRIDDQELIRIRANVVGVGQALGQTREQSETFVTDTVRGYLTQLHEDGPAAVLERFKGAVERLHDQFRGQEDVLDRVMQDLLETARADGTVLDMEVFLLDKVADAWSHVAAP